MVLVLYVLSCFALKLAVAIQPWYSVTHYVKISVLELRVLRGYVCKNSEVVSDCYSVQFILLSISLYYDPLLQ